MVEAITLQDRKAYCLHMYIWNEPNQSYSSIRRSLVVPYVNSPLIGKEKGKVLEVS